MGSDSTAVNGGGLPVKNVLFGGMRAVPHAQLETAAAYGMTPRQTFWRVLVPQMWVYALPGLSNRGARSRRRGATTRTTAVKEASRTIPAAATT